MPEETGRQQMIDDILDHPDNSGRDPHEARALYIRIKDMSYTELESERNLLD